MSDQPPNNEEWQQPQQPPYNEQWHQQSYPQQPYSAYQPNAQQPNPEQWQQSQQPPTNEQWHQQQPNPNYQQYSQQLMYPQQPMYPQQLPKKKSRLWLWIVLGVVGVLVLGCIGVVVAVSSAARSISTTNVSAVETAAATTGTGNTPSTTGQVAKVGQTITIQDIAATLISVKKLPDDQYSPASPGNTYIVVHVKLVNNSSGEVNYNAFDFHVKSGSGNITDEAFTSSYTGNNQINSGKLSPGGSVEGDIVFQTGKSDHKAQLTWQPSFFGNAGDNGWLLGL